MRTLADRNHMIAPAERFFADSPVVSERDRVRKRNVEHVNGIAVGIRPDGKLKYQNRSASLSWSPTNARVAYRS